MYKYHGTFTIYRLRSNTRRIAIWVVTILSISTFVIVMHDIMYEWERLDVLGATSPVSRGTEEVTVAME